MQHPSDHNLPVSPADRAALELESALAGPRERWEAIQAATASRPEIIADETTAENFTTVVAQLQALIKRVDSAHDDVKEPYLAAGRAVDNVTNRLRGDVLQLKRDLEASLTAYQAEKQRKIREDRERIRQLEAQDPEPSFVPHQQIDRRRSRVRSIEGATAHLIDQIDVEIVDVRALPDRYLNRPKVLAALRTEILPDAKKGDQIEGIKVHSGVQSRVKA